jgi:hypothetical protein
MAAAAMPAPVMAMPVLDLDHGAVLRDQGRNTILAEADRVIASEASYAAPPRTIRLMQRSSRRWIAT